MRKLQTFFAFFVSFGSFAKEVHVEKAKMTLMTFLFAPKFITMFILGTLSLILLKTNKMNEKIRISLLVLSTFLFGIAGNLPVSFFKSFAMHPSPICASTKPFLYGFGIPFMAMLLVIAVLTIIGPKLFCSYICPVGAVQELTYSISKKRKIKVWKINYKIFNVLRIGIFLSFIVFSITKIYHIVYKEKIYGLSIYDKFNPFHGFEFQMSETFFSTFLHYLPLLLTIILAIKIYRPFCYAICPIGLFTNILERISIFKLTFNKENCTNCNLCVSKTNCPSISEVIKESKLKPDCFACNACIEKCNYNALKYGIKNS